MGRNALSSVALCWGLARDGPAGGCPRPPGRRHEADRDPAQWRPPRSGAGCGFARDWVTVKLRWDLSADEAEAGALREMLAAC
jgi:hypothetical protein